MGSFPAGRGPFGTLDQAGNVWEWCADVWSDTAYRQWANVIAVDPVNDQGDESIRVLRGGAWLNPAEDLRAAFRLGYPAVRQHDSVGFRVAAVPARRLDP